jgi:hypothetical protein
MQNRAQLGPGNGIGNGRKAGDRRATQIYLNAIIITPLSKIKRHLDALAAWHSVEPVEEVARPPPLES